MFPCIVRLGELAEDFHRDVEQIKYERGSYEIHHNVIDLCIFSIAGIR